jgi:hypothetical protein
MAMALSSEKYARLVQNRLVIQGSVRSSQYFVCNRSLARRLDIEQVRISQNRIILSLRSEEPQTVAEMSTQCDTQQCRNYSVSDYGTSTAITSVRSKDRPTFPGTEQTVEVDHAPIIATYPEWIRPQDSLPRRHIGPSMKKLT